jgi:hypothetical protein
MKGDWLAVRGGRLDGVMDGEATSGGLFQLMCMLFEARKFAFISKLSISFVYFLNV